MSKVTIEQQLDSATPLSATISTQAVAIPVSAGALSAIVPSGGSVWDYVLIGYNNSNAITAVEYKQGGSGGTTVLSMGLGYDSSSNLSSVTKTSVV